MQRSHPNWARTFVRRGLVAAVLVLALATYGLVTAGTQSSAFKPTAAAVNSTAGRSVSQAISPTNGSLNVATQGPNHSLYFFWNVAGKWYGPLGVGAPGSTYSAPTILSQGNGNFDIAAQGPNNSLYFYWDITGTWYGPYGVAGPGTTFSTPGLVEDNNNNLQIATQGPANTLDVYWNTAAQFYGPLGIGGPGSTFSGPAITLSGSDLYVQVQGRNHDLEEYHRFGTAPWSGVSDSSNDNTVYSAPWAVSGGFALFQGPNNSLWESEGAFTPVFVQIRGGGSTYSMPSLTNNTDFIAAEGPSNTLWYYFYNNSTSNFDGPLQIGSPGSTFSAPSLIQDASSNQDIAVQGPGNALWAYFDIGGTIHGPLQIGGPGTSFSSSN
jgi:hypothetical protein